MISIETLSNMILGYARLC